ncbi:hypothetical protein PHMEG_00019564 [Phytophthora megakarya]|uniref:Uncharacterized protein n=1 Tax=Phytophthora megakarya TaxID=4795 RepID=A0A225VR75_9STRA|nr:hypothetical protein PHMEG_00019564 [Phytophthora megakarya]
MEEQWRFLAPWTCILKDRFCHTLTEINGGISGKLQLLLQVNIPEGPIRYNPNSDICSSIERQITHEGLKLLAAVAHVDYDSWRYLLVHHCGVNLGHEGEEKFESEILVRYQIRFFHTMDLVQMCGTRQHYSPRRLYTEALETILAMSGKVQKNWEIQIPVQVILSPNPWSNEGKLNHLLMIRAAEKLIREEWNTPKEQSPPLEAKFPRCSFVLEPMIAEFGHDAVDEDTANILETLVLENVWFSSVSLTIDLPEALASNARLRKLVLGKLTSRLFDSTRRCKDIGLNHINCNNQSKQLQLDRIDLRARFLQPPVFEALYSAMIHNQVASEVSFLGMMDVYDRITWWKWLAYALFSNRARAYSSCERVSMTWISRMATADIEAFSSVLVSKHPEEELFNCTRGLVDEQDATLTANAAVRWEFDERNEPVLNSEVLSFPCSTPHVRTFSDNGESEWVNVIIPGYGRCQVQRENLVFHESRNQDLFCPLQSLEIGFGGPTVPISSGLPLFLSCVGQSLRVLTIGAVQADVEVNMILERCPNLHTLCLRKKWASAKFNFAEYQAHGLPLPQVSFESTDISTLANELGDANSGLTKCLERLEVRLNFEEDIQTTNRRLKNELAALLLMLGTNQRLEYFRLHMAFRFSEYIADFRKYHQIATNQSIKLPIACKNAFLSVLSYNAGIKRRTGWLRRTMMDFNVDVITIIFQFAATPVLRKIFVELE